MFSYYAKILKVVDGDTLKLDLDLGFRCHIFETVRLARLDTPEVVNYEATGIVDPAKSYIENNLPVGSFCVVQITRQEKYGRWLAELFYLPNESDPMKITVNPRCLNDELLRGGFAKSYSGGKK
jgi:micrococcal nuclease